MLNTSHLQTSLQRCLKGKSAVKICSKFTEEHPCWSVIYIKFLCNFVEIILRHACPPVNLLYAFRTPFNWNHTSAPMFACKSVLRIFRTPFYKNIYGRLLLHIVFIDILDLDNTDILATNPSPFSGGSTKLSCAVNANPKVIRNQWLWKKNGIQILSGSSELILENVTQNDSANYECVAESSLGSTSSMLQVMVQCK